MTVVIRKGHPHYDDESIVYNSFVSAYISIPVLRNSGKGSKLKTIFISSFFIFLDLLYHYNIGMVKMIFHYLGGKYLPRKI